MYTMTHTYKYMYDYRDTHTRMFLAALFIIEEYQQITEKSVDWYCKICEYIYISNGMLSNKNQVARVR